ncbi:15-hydroxyprostaglandin dehydrogenase [NAD(+)]-like [Haemaphysalis longicornis]
MHSFADKVALVTGGTRGLGRAIADALLDKGCKVSILGRDETSGEQATIDLLKKHPNGSCVFYKCDVTDDRQLEEVFIQTKNHFGCIDILVNNAGIADEDNWKEVLAVNLHAVFAGITLGLKHMDRSKGGQGGHIVNVSSIAGLLVVPELPAYCVSKQAVVAMTRCFGSDFYWNRHAVRVNCICPDPIDTLLWKQVSDSCEQSEDTAQLSRIFGPRVQPASLVAQAVLKLLQDEPNGATLLCLKETGINYYDFPSPMLPQQ